VSGQFGEDVPAPDRRSATLGRRAAVESVFRPSSEGPRGSAGPGPSHHATSRLRRRRGVVEAPTGLLPCSAPWGATGPRCMRLWRCAGEERVRRMLIRRPRSEISVQRDTALLYGRETGRRRRLRAAPPPDDLKIDATHPWGRLRGGKLSAHGPREGEGLGERGGHRLPRDASPGSRPRYR